MEKLKELLIAFEHNFLDARDVAKMRIKLAQRNNRTYSEEIEYFRRRNLFEQGEIGALKCLAQVFGYAFGTYTTFCPFQETLDRFDKEFERFRTQELSY